MNPAAGDIRKAFREFRDRGDDLLNANLSTLKDRLKRFALLCRDNKVLDPIVRPLLTNNRVDLGSWLNESARLGEPLVFPDDEEDRLALCLQFVNWASSSELDVISYLPNWFSLSGGLTSTISEFLDIIVAPCVRDIGYKIQEIEEELPQQNSQEVPYTVLQVFNHGQFVQQIATGNSNTQSANIQIQNSDIQSLIAEIRQLAKSQALTPEDAAKSSELIDAAADELATPKPRRTVVESLLKALPFATAAANLIAAVIKII